MKLHSLLWPLLTLTTMGFAASQEFTILDGKKVTADMSNGLPRPAEKDGIKIEVAAFMIQEGQLIYTFGFTTEKKVQKVTVEEVSGSRAIPLVADTSPELENAYWKGDAKPLPLNKSGVPWIFEKGDTVKVFRFSVTLAGAAAPIVLHQPAIYGAAAKTQLQQLAQ